VNVPMNSATYFFIGFDYSFHSRGKVPPAHGIWIEDRGL